MSPVEVSAATFTDYEFMVADRLIYETDKPIWTAYTTNGNTSSPNFRVGQGYADIDIVYKFRFRSTTNSALTTRVTEKIDGFLDFNEVINLDVYPINGDPLTEFTSSAWCSNIMLLDVVTNDKDIGLYLSDKSSYSVTNIPAAVRYGAGRSLNYNLNLGFIFHDFQSLRTSYLFEVTFKFRAYFDNINVSETNLYYHSIFNYQQGSVSGLLAKNNNELYALNSLDSKISSVNSNITSSASQAHNDSVAEKNAINSAASQAHSDQQAMQNIMQNDNSGFSTQQAQEKANIDAANQAADSAVDNSVHNYSAELQEVKDFDWSNFFTAQSSSASFWRDVGEYILDPSNLGFIATGLIVVTVITLFVFMLRL